MNTYSPSQGISQSMTDRFLRIVVALWWMLLCVPTMLAASAVAASNQPAAAKPVVRTPGPPNIILITLDTTRADRMGFLGSKRGLTPNLDALAKQAAVFVRAYTQAPLTPPAHASILTGTYPQFHHVNDFETALAQDLPYAPEILRAHGYHTAAFIASIVLEARPPYAPGFDRGFDTYDTEFHNDGPGQDRYRTVQRRGQEVVAHALAWLSRHRAGPFFIWVHLYDAHDPYDPPEPYKTRYASALYDGGIAYEDAAVGKLLRQLKLRGLYDGSVIAVTADHGESLGAHGEDTHGIFLYDETMHVPLLIKLPRATTGGKRIENRVELVDITPTLLQETGIEIPQEMQGVSLLGLMKGEIAGGNPETWHDRPAYSQSEYPTHFGWSALRSLRSEKYLYVQAPRRELYDESTDSKSEHNLAASSSAIADTLASQLDTFRRKTSSDKVVPKAELDLAAQEKLGALGYMAAGGNTSKSGSDQGPDPKDKIEIANMIHRADVLQEDMHADESIALLEQVIAKNPTTFFYIKLATWLMRKQDYEKAVVVLRKSLEMEPDSAPAQFMLTKCLMLTQDYQAAIPELEKLVAKVPNAVEAHSFLELAYARTNRVADAIKECRTVLQYDPDDSGSYLILGQSLARSGDPEAGVAALKKAASLEPGSPIAHLWLADIYDQLGRQTDAVRERAEAKRLGAVPSGPKAPYNGRAGSH
jgi:arylsulfatase A-like enzyme/cytochrome c-type biogenesis protein CcmH/NrfG